MAEHGENATAGNTMSTQYYVASISNYLFIMGSTFIILGIIGVTLNAIDAFAILANNGSLKNPFYYFVINICIADIICLIGIGCYNGIELIFNAFVDDAVQCHFFATTMHNLYYASGWFQIMICLTRLAVFSNSNWATKFLQMTKVKCITLVLWFIYIGQGSLCYLSSGSLFSAYIQFRYWHSVSFYFITPALILGINGITLYKIMRLQKSMVNVTVGQTQSQSLEIKLFIQCGISSGFYCINAIWTAIAFLTPFSPNAAIALRMSWILNHVNNSVIYLILNAKIRQTIRRYICSNNDVVPVTVSSRRGVIPLH